MSTLAKMGTTSAKHIKDKHEKVVEKKDLQTFASTSVNEKH